MRTLGHFSCHRCGASCYRRVLARDSAGALRPNGLFHCTGCTLVFADPRNWRDGAAAPAPLPAAGGVGKAGPAGPTGLTGRP